MRTLFVCLWCTLHGHGTGPVHTSTCCLRNLYCNRTDSFCFYTYLVDLCTGYYILYENLIYVVRPRASKLYSISFKLPFFLRNMNSFLKMTRVDFSQTEVFFKSSHIIDLFVKRDDKGRTLSIKLQCYLIRRLSICDKQQLKNKTRTLLS